MSRSYPETFIYWITERLSILQKKESGDPKPWSQDPVFQTTYFTNVRREDDKVTHWIRLNYSHYVDHELFLYNMVLARFINNIPALKEIGFRYNHNADLLRYDLRETYEKLGRLWGGAYIITTHGMQMDKVTYLVDHVLRDVDGMVEPLYISCDETHKALMEVDGLGSFLAAQVVADLKNTYGHELTTAPDWWTFAAHGPGSLKGASWFKYGEPGHVSPSKFPVVLNEIREYYDSKAEEYKLPKICNQDLQNCLCEFDKYCRIMTRTGRSKRGYNGS